MAPIKESVYATLLLNDKYLDGALVVAKSLRNGHTQHKLAVLVTPETVSQATIDALEESYDHIIHVGTKSNTNTAGLAIMGRLDLAHTFTKIALFSLTQFARIVYLDADTLPLRAPDELFALPASTSFAAAPELGFPDCFNSGMMVLTPGDAVYAELSAMAAAGESFDGGDQGLLNACFEGRFERLSFGYNVELNQVFRLYMPAVKHYGKKIAVLHFIGKTKPWDVGRVTHGDGSAYSGFYEEAVGKWWDVAEELGLEGKL